MDHIALFELISGLGVFIVIAVHITVHIVRRPKKTTLTLRFDGWLKSR